ncbi:hypothetical protein BD324DRAFT_653986 [Kockovaella imperatae]|uniref:Protein kinase domain-containing protein n=1 Tax=Kockovaella imperatae TaxID=4999 RepID=A0A1Y1U6M5_9TREE|nr:hypothetical protein BD324DRAFT_653986 [Kockovaella imperatae]ORX33690.1 hypothetical protein BD324DRAFT_653986 [Kockovaella imperatae]
MPRKRKLVPEAESQPRRSTRRAIAHVVESHPYCSEDCIRSLRNGALGPQGTHCPNERIHRASAAPRLEQWQEDLSRALAEGSTRTRICRSLGRSGVRGTMLKLVLESSGHCLIGKGFHTDDVYWFNREVEAYQRLESFQGDILPVCSGSLTLEEEIQIHAGDKAIKYLVFLSYGGTPILHLKRRDPDAFRLRYRRPILACLEQMHEHQVIHGDAEIRNVLWNENTDRVLFVDFERSRLYENRPACPPDEPCKKQYKDKKGRKQNCMYCRELWVANWTIDDENLDPDGSMERRNA